MSWLERHPVVTTCLTGLGVAMLAAGLFGLLAPLGTLDKLYALGDGKLVFALIVLLVAALAITALGAAAVAISQRKDGLPPPGDEPPSA